MPDTENYMLSRRRFIGQSVTASAMLAGASITSFQLLNPKGLGDQAILLNHESANLIKKLRANEVKYFSKTTNIAIAPENKIDVIEPLDSMQIEASAKLKFVEEDVSSTLVDNASEIWHQRVVRFDENLPGDIFLKTEQIPLLKTVANKLAKVQRYVGYGNFNLISFDEMLFHGRNQSTIGAFTKVELDFLDSIFNQDAKNLGFMGEKVVADMTRNVANKDVRKIKGSGHYLYRGESEVQFKKISAILGDDLVLTSGIRGIVKQYHLFLAKAVKVKGNLSRASRSLAPPGYSYHALGDFDVGQKGLGSSNFTSEFADSDVFKRLTDLGFIKIRYTLDNRFGVRFEPWHIRVV